MLLLNLITSETHILTFSASWTRQSVYIYEALHNKLFYLMEIGQRNLH